MQIKTITAMLAIATVSLGLTACGGGGGSSAGSNPTPNPTPTPTGPSWEPGVYASEASLVARCESPRTGTDPFTGQAYPDQAGSSLEEKLWLRSWTNNTYLWYDEVDDNNPANFSVLGYFDQLKTTAITPSGSAKDNFHFYESTDEYNELTQTGVSSGYGFDWEFIRNTAPRELVVRFTEPGSPAQQAGIPRGASVKRVNGIDFVNATSNAEVDGLNAALFPAENGTTTQFVFELVDGSELAVDVTSADVEVSPVQNVQILDAAAGTTGYFQFNTFIRTAQPELIDAFDLFVDENVTELVIDLRYNGGGLLALASQVSYMVAGPGQTNNAIFETTQFNDKSSTVNPVTGEQIYPTPFYDSEIDYNAGRLLNTLLPSLSLTRVFVLTTESTCSASESVMNALRGIDVEVVQIGSSTCGKPYGFYPTDNCGVTYFSIQFQGVNNKGFGDYADGFAPSESPMFDNELPGCVVSDDFSQSLGNPAEGMLSAALGYAATGTCPEPVSPAPVTPDNLSRENTRESSPAIINPNTLRQRFILHNKIVEPVLTERK